MKLPELCLVVFVYKHEKMFTEHEHSKSLPTKLDGKITRIMSSMSSIIYIELAVSLSKLIFLNIGWPHFLGGL